MTPESLPAQRAPEAFFQAQKRNRRATWRMSLLCMLASFVMGVPLTLVLTPLVYAGTLAVAEVVNYFSPLPPEFWENIGLVARILEQVNGAITNHRSIDPVLLGFAAAVVLLPGMVIAVVLWMGLRTLLRRGGVGGMLATLNARMPDKNDLKELQLADVVEEMAIAAGLPAPRVMLLDSGGANAAVFGTSAMDARIVLSRRLLDDLTRDQLQGVLGHLISSIGNGDLSIAFTVTSVFETSGLIVTLINTPFGSQSRGILWRLIRYSFSSRTSVAGSDSEADELAALLTRNMGSDSDDIDRFYDSSQTDAPLWRKFLRMVFFPMIFTNAAIKMSLWFFSYVLLGPCMALLWRTRRYLADASAVQLTRSPDGLASALQALNADDTSIPGGGWGAHLFLMNPGHDRSMAAARPSPEQMQRAVQAWRESGGESQPPAAQASVAAAGNAADFAGMRTEIAQNARAAMSGDPQAVARMTAFASAMSAHGDLPAGMPNLEDLMAARQGDQAARRRIEMSNQQRSRTGTEKAGLQGQSMLSFHPPLKRRLKRLQRMGAHVEFGTAPKRPLWATALMAVLWLILAPLMIAAGAAVLAAITVMIGLNLLFLALWLAVIHFIFGLIGHR
ncbi:MAG: M48 family metalloprotease [Acidobacteriia bacterium]|nr:M48 family metalloprotease [Terriglobia bacterium]